MTYSLFIKCGVSRSLFGTQLAPWAHLVILQAVEVIQVLLSIVF